MRRALFVLAGVVCSFVSPSASACKELVLFPEHLEVGAGSETSFYVVEILSIHNDSYTGKVTRSFGGLWQPGDAIEIQYASGEEAHAVCPIKFELGVTYLMQAVQPGATLVVSRFDGLNVPSTHERFATYVQDVASRHSQQRP